MFFRINPEIRRQAKSPHELAMINLLLLNLLMLIALLAGSFAPKDSVLAHYKLAGVLVPLAISLGIIGYTWLRAGKRDHAPWFVAMHWQVAAQRYKILLIGYLVGAALIGGGWLLAQGQADARMAGMMFVALQRVAIAPMLIVLMVVIMFESGSIYQAGRGEVPDGLTKAFPPPDDLEKVDQPVFD